MLRSLGVVGMFAFACSHDGGAIALADYATADARAVCDYAVRCGLFADEASCLAYGLVKLDPDSYTALIDAGKATFDGVAAQQCIDALDAASCDVTQMSERVPSPACAHILVGTVAMGGACEDNAECQSAACAIPECGSACCAGTCIAAQAPGGSGDPCATRDCDTGLACNAATETCQPLAGSGAGCSLDSDCAYGLGCPRGQCEPLPGIGDPCPDGECAELGAICNAQGMCVMVGLPGSPCTTNADCSQYATCNGTTCMAQPTLGQPCTFACSDGSYCTGEDGSGSGTCVAPAGSGASCTYDAACASNYCGSDATCGAVPICL